MSCVGRFAPSPTGPLHAGSLVAALASWLDVRAWGLRHPGHSARWLVRIEDVDRPRCVPGMDRHILHQLEQFGLVSDEPAVWQSARGALYQAALDALTARQATYPCNCSRKTIESRLNALGPLRQRHGELVYPGICRNGMRGGGPAAWRLRVPPGMAIPWEDRRLGMQEQNVGEAVGDFVLKRADGCFTYQLAVVVDDAAQGVTHVVRGEDLADNTARQRLLQQLLGYPTPRYLHTPLVRATDGEKLSKQNGAQPVDTGQAGAALNAAAQTLELPSSTASVPSCLLHWAGLWAQRFPRD